MRPKLLIPLTYMVSNCKLIITFKDLFIVIVVKRLLSSKKNKNKKKKKNKNKKMLMLVKSTAWYLLP